MNKHERLLRAENERSDLHMILVLPHFLSQSSYNEICGHGGRIEPTDIQVPMDLDEYKLLKSKDRVFLIGRNLLIKDSCYDSEVGLVTCETESKIYFAMDDYKAIDDWIKT